MASDNFAGSGVLLSPWASDSVWTSSIQRVGGVADTVAGGSRQLSVYVGSANSSEVLLVSAFGPTEPACDCDGAGSCYFINDAGYISSLTPSGDSFAMWLVTTPTAGDTVRLARVGADIVFYLNGIVNTTLVGAPVLGTQGGITSYWNGYPVGSWTDGVGGAAALAGAAQDIATAIANLRNTHALAGNAQDIATGFGSLYPLTKVTSVASANGLKTSVPLAVGDIIELLSVTGGLITDVTINPDTTFDWLDGVTGFIYRVFDGTDGTWGLPALQNTIAVTGFDLRGWAFQRKNKRNGSLDALRYTQQFGETDKTERTVWLAHYGFSSQAAAASLAAAAQSVVTASAALTAAIRLAGAAADTASAVGGLLTSIRLGGNAADSATATANLTAAIRLAVNAVATATANGALTAAVLLSGQAQDVVTAAGSLVGGAAALTGAAADNVLSTGNLLTNINLAGSAIDVITASGAIVTGIPLLGAAQGSVSAAGALSTTPSGMTGTAVTVMTASGALVTGISLGGVASDVVTSTGAMTTQIRLAAAAQVVATAVASLNAQIQLAASAINNVIGTGLLSGGALLVGAAQTISLATGGLSTLINLLGGATAQVSAGGALSVGVKLDGAASNVSTASGTLATNAAALVGAAQDIITAIGILSTGIALSGNAQVVSASSAAMATSIRLMGAAQSTVTISAVLGSAAVIRRLPVYCVLADLNERFSEGELLQLTDRANTGSIDLVVVNRAMLDADAKINSYLHGRYALPMPRVPRVLNLYACEITRYRLYDDRVTEQVVKRYKAAIRFLTMVAKGAISLGVDNAEQPAVSSTSYVQAGDRVFTTDKLKDFKS